MVYDQCDENEIPFRILESFQWFLFRFSQINSIGNLEFILLLVVICKEVTNYIFFYNLHKTDKQGHTFNVNC